MAVGHWEHWCEESHIVPVHWAHSGRRVTPAAERRLRRLLRRNAAGLSVSTVTISPQHPPVSPQKKHWGLLEPRRYNTLSQNDEHEQCPELLSNEMWRKVTVNKLSIQSTIAKWVLYLYQDSSVFGKCGGNLDVCHDISSLEKPAGGTPQRLNY